LRLQRTMPRDSILNGSCSFATIPPLCIALMSAAIGLVSFVSGVEVRTFSTMGGNEIRRNANACYWGVLACLYAER
jgi:hypothetical protein